MRKNNKIIAGILCVSIIFTLLTGCGKETPPDVSSNTIEQRNEVTADTPDTEAETASGEEQHTPKERVETIDFREIAKKNQTDNRPLVGMVTFEGGVDDASYNQSAWEGLQWLSGRTNCNIKFLESDGEADFSENIHKLIDDGAKLCWGIGYSGKDDLLEEAAEHPDINFAIVDNSFEDAPANLTGVMFRAQEPSFLVGYIAGSVTSADKVGYIGGEKSSILDQFEYGYKAGVAYAAKELNKDIEVCTEYAGTFSDPAKGHELAAKMYADGCDIIFHAAGETGTGVIEEAAAEGKFVIGVDKDQSYLAPENVLTSALKYVNIAVCDVSEVFLEGEDIGGKTITFGLAEGAVGVSEDHSLYSDEIYDKMLDLAEQIRAGSLIPPSNSYEYEDFII